MSGALELALGDLRESLGELRETVRPRVPDASALAAGYASQLQYTLRQGAIDKLTGERSPVTVEQGRGLVRVIDNIDKRVRGEEVAPLRMIVAGGPGTVAGNSQYGPKLDKLRKYWGDAWLLVIDEAFMVGLTDLGIAWANILTVIDDEDIDVVFVGR